MRLWIALIVAPLLAFTDQSVAFALVGWSCAHQSILWIHVTHLAFLAAATTCAAFAWREWRAAKTARPAPVADPALQHGFLAGIATLTATLSVASIATMWLPTWMIASCIA
jgi:hypothetical protein